jgi:tetratricopeptide (TPR) repeat protein
MEALRAMSIQRVARQRPLRGKVSLIRNFASRDIHGSILDVGRSTKLPAIGAILALLAIHVSVARAQDSNAAKAHALVEAAIKMTDSEKAVKLLWQATDIDPSLEEPYAYLGMYYNSKQDSDDLVKVYQKLVKYEPTSLAAWLNLGEAYMSFTPPKTTEALPCYRKAYELDKTSAMAALRMGEIMAQEGDREQAIRFLHQAASSPVYAEEARKVLTQMGAS